MNKNVCAEVVAHNLCVGCGICVTACPQSAITIDFHSKKGMFVPKIDFSRCDQCGTCYQICPKNFSKFFEEKTELLSQDPPFIEGYGNILNSHVGYVNDEKERVTSASGGILTALLKYMLKQNIIDGAVVVKPNENSLDKPLFRPFLAKTDIDLDEAKGSHYYPIEMSGILSLINGNGKVAIVGAPCVIGSIQRLVKIRNIQDITIYYFTLVCGGTRNANFVKHIIGSRDKTKIKKDSGYKLKATFRDKTAIKRADNFNFTDGVEYFGFTASVYGELWYSDIYKLNGCNFCPDFSGYRSDLAVMDAWLDEYRSDAKGTSIVLSRNRRISEMLSSMREKGILTLLPIEIEKAVKAQYSQIEKADRRFYTWSVLKGVLNNKTKQYLQNHGYRVEVKYILELISYRIRMFFGFLLYDKMKLYHIHPLYLNLLTSPSRLLKGLLRKIKRQGPQLKHKVVIGCTAYGCGNIGDEAIVHAIVQSLTEGTKIDRQQIKILTAKPEQLRERLQVGVGSSRFYLCIKEFATAEFVVCGGATVLSDYTSRFFVRSLIAIIMGKKVIYFGVGANEIAKGYLTRLLIRTGMRFARLITVRDEQTKRHLQKLGVKRGIFVMGDPAHSIKDAEPNKIGIFLHKWGVEKQKKYLVIGLSGEPNFKRQIPVDEIAKAVKTISERYALVPLYLAMNFNPNQDTPLLEEVRKKSKTYGLLVSEDVKPEVIFSLLEFAKLIISTRLHLAILGATKGVPIIGIARGSKMNNLFEELKLKIMPSVADVTEADLVAEADRIMRDYKRIAQNVSNQIQEIIQKNQKGFNLLKKELLFNR